MKYLIPEKREKPCSKEREMYRKTCQTQELPEIDLYFAGRVVSINLVWPLFVPLYGGIIYRYRKGGYLEMN